MKRLSVLFCALILCAMQPTGRAAGGPSLDEGFRTPPVSARPWVYWFWINGNISKEGITADLEALKRVGIGGVLWMEVGGPWWAPDGEVVPLSPGWHEAMQWAIRECARLGIQFDLTLDFGYGSGGLHITPELSMQQLVWSEKEIEGGQRVDVTLERAQVKKGARPRPRAGISPQVLGMLEKTDGYKDVAVVAIPLPASRMARDWRNPGLSQKNGLNWKYVPPEDPPDAPPAAAVTPLKGVIDLTDHMDRGGRLMWDVPAGKWLVLRYGHMTNYKMTRPCPAAAIGLECDRLASAGIDAHYVGFLKKIFEGAGAEAGRALSFVHIDSWEAGGQNWTDAFPAEFRKLRGYDVRPWLPVLTGRVVGGLELSDRFLWDVRATVGEMIRDNYVSRLRALAQTNGIKLSTEAYGRLCIDNLAYAGAGDMPIGEFWAQGDGLFPTPRVKGAAGYAMSSKAMASAAHVYGKPVVGAESFTSDRGWRDHPFTLKAMGDAAFCDGVNRMILHLSAHQAYDNMIPGLTHRNSGEHIQRHNTWFDYSQPWMDYLARCQYLLQEGKFAGDVLYCFGEGAPLSVDQMKLDLPAGYDYDLCSAEIALKLKVADGRIVAPSGTSYRYLLLPGTGRMTVPLARKVRELVEAGARVVGGPKPKGSPGLTDYPRCDREVAAIGAELWDTGCVASDRNLGEVFRRDGLKPDFEGEGLLYLHRRMGEAEVYFVAHPENRALDRICTFRIDGNRPELWDPESGAIRRLTDFTLREGRVAVPLHFEPLQSWFVVFRSTGMPAGVGRPNFTAPRTLRAIDGSWQVTFDSRWGGPEKAVDFATLTDWSRHADPRIHYYSGTATYRKTLSLSAAEASGKGGRLLLDLGAVEVMGRVRLNGKECGIAWKPPYRVDLSAAAREGANELEIETVNLWINRMIGDEQLPEDITWKDFETLAEWPAWFKAGQPRPSGRFTFTTAKHYEKDTPLVPSGLLGPVTLKAAPGGTD